MGDCRVEGECHGERQAPGGVGELGRDDIKKGAKE